jgi:hypothetical protein
MTQQEPDPNTEFERRAGETTEEWYERLKRHPQYIEFRCGRLDRWENLDRWEDAAQRAYQLLTLEVIAEEVRAAREHAAREQAAREQAEREQAERKADEMT